MPRTKQRGYDGRYAEKLGGMYQSIDNYTKILTESMLYDLRQSMNVRILAAGKNARLDACGDKIYDAYVRLVMCYKRAVRQYESMADVLVSPKIKNIMEGILSVINSRCCIHEPQELTEDLSENPVFVEKKSIINKGIDSFNEAFHVFGEAFMADELPGCKLYSRGLFVTLDEHTDYAENGLALARNIAGRQDATLRDEIYKIYNDIVKNSLSRLNDLESSEDILRYKELLEQEREILGALVQIQLPRLEKDQACSPMEEAVVESITAPIAEAYENLERDIAEIHMGIGEPGKSVEEEPAPDELWTDELLKAVLAATNYEGFAYSLKTELAEVWHSLEHDIGIVTEREISNRLFARAMYEFRKLITSHVLIADEMLQIFKRLEDTARGLEFPDGDGKIIAEGIIETVQIKIESLRENKDAFYTEAAAKLKKLRGERPKLELKDLGEIAPVIEPEVRAAFFSSYRQKMQRHITAHQDYSLKKSISFKRDHLLFEIITFEEIINYSVSRIRNYDDAATREFVEYVDTAWTDLQNMLAQNRIIAIAPSVHEMFNGREHEVLVAEKNPEFEKGEIIKLMNCGYKQDDVVLVRANVVAAV